MPRLSRWMVRAAFAYFLLGFTFGALLLAHKVMPLHSGLWAWRPAHIEFLLWGWIVQLTMGLAFWILPRYWQKPRRLNERLGSGALLAGRLTQLAAVLFLLATPGADCFQGRGLKREQKRPLLSGPGVHFALSSPDYLPGLTFTLVIRWSESLTPTDRLASRP